MLTERIENDFAYHAPNAEAVEDMKAIRGFAKALALTVATCVPSGREQALALTNLEQAVMWANAGIARDPEGQA